MKRFMSWLLRQIQRLFGSLSGRRSDHVSSTELGNEIASRLRQSRDSDADAPTDIEDRRSSHRNPISQLNLGQKSGQPDRSETSELDTPSTAIQSPTPLHQKSSSTFEDTVDLAVEEPDTHHRLDAAAAAKEGSPTVTPSFPTEVSDLISDASTLKVDVSANTLNNLPSSPPQSLSAPDVEAAQDAEVENKQLPEIHDLLPAIEPDEHSKSSIINAAPSIEKPNSIEPDPLKSDASDQPSAQVQVNSITIEPVEEAVPTATRGSVNIPVVDDRSETTASQPTRVEMANETVISKETSAETAVDETHSTAERKVESVNGEGDEAVTLFSFDIVEQEVVEQEVVEQEVVEQAVTDATPQSLLLDAEENEAIVPEESTSTSDESAQFDHQTETSSDVSNPWLEARQSISTQSSSEGESKPDIFEKSGTVKLLFKLKPGNFHGYIAPEDGSRDILFHQKYINADIFDDLERGSHVVATARQVAGKVYATHVALLKE